MKALKRLNEGLPGLILGILIWGVLVELVGVWFYPDKIRYTTGVLFGTGCCVFSAIHMAMMIADSVACGGVGTAQTMVKAKSGLRFLLVFIILAVMIHFNLGWWGTAFIALFGLKAGAYSQPLLNKLKKVKEEKE